MARSKADRASSAPTTGKAQAATPIDASAAEPLPSAQAVPEPVPSAQERPERTPTLTPDPRGVMSISLGDGKGSPRMRLLRSHKYKQMQITFERQPDEKYLAMLKEAGWTDRTESEGVWTKQVGQGQWQPVADAERVFKDVANAIRTDKGLKPAMEGVAVA